MGRSHTKKRPGPAAPSSVTASTSTTSAAPTPTVVTPPRTTSSTPIATSTTTTTAGVAVATSTPAVDHELVEDDSADEPAVDMAGVDLTTFRTNAPAQLERELGTMTTAAGAAISAVTQGLLANSAGVGRARQLATDARDEVDGIEALGDRIRLLVAQCEAYFSDADLDEDDRNELGDMLGDYETLYPKVRSAAHTWGESLAEALGRIGLAEDALNADAAEAEQLRVLRAHWGSVALARGHFERHRDDTGAANEIEYLTRALALNQRAAGGNILRKTREDGDILTFDRSTGEFTIITPAGKIRTLFCPGDGVRYYNRQ